MTRVSLMFVALLASGGLAFVQTDDTVERIAGAAVTHGGAGALLEQLTDSIGGRLTGSAQSRETSEWLLATLKASGYDNARFEEYPIRSRWSRGRAAGRIVSPIARPLHVGSFGWVPGTQGEISAPVVDLGKPPGNDLPVPAERVRGAAVMVDPHELDGVAPQVMRAALARELARAGALAMLVPSDKPGRMLFSSAFGLYPRGPLPVLSVAKEDALLLRRLLAKGAVRIGLDIANTFDTTPAKERNVIADLPGRNRDDIVLVGGHFDSWDPAEGADDDGSGIAAVLEAARILKRLDVRPRRTIRFAFFSGEEEALLGSWAYVASHRTELDHLRAVLIMDAGAQVPRGFDLHGRADLEAPLKKLLAPLAALGASGVSLEATFDMDHAPFLASGVPALSLWVDAGDYDSHHHAITDTFDKVDARLLALDTAVMAVAAYALADAEEGPGRRLSPAEITELMNKTHLEPLRAITFGATGP